MRQPSAGPESEIQQNGVTDDRDRENAYYPAWDRATRTSAAALFRPQRIRRRHSASPVSRQEDG